MKKEKKAIDLVDCFLFVLFIVSTIDGLVFFFGFREWRGSFDQVKSVTNFLIMLYFYLKYWK